MGDGNGAREAWTAGAEALQQPRNHASAEARDPAFQRGFPGRLQLVRAGKLEDSCIRTEAYRANPG